MKTNWFTGSGAVCVSIALLSTGLAADESKGEIFKSESTQGTPEYTDRKKSEKHRTVKLPLLIQDKEEAAIQAPLPRLQTCQRRGGVDCEAGRVKDSAAVFCMDGSKSFSENYTESCLEARLKKMLYVEFSNAPETVAHRDVYKGLQAIDKRAPSGFLLEIRNTTPVAARIKAAYIRLPFLSPSRVELKGPETIEAYGLGLYRVSAKRFPQGVTPRHLAEAKAVIECINCRN